MARVRITVTDATGTKNTLDVPCTDNNQARQIGLGVAATQSAQGRKVTLSTGRDN